MRLTLKQEQIRIFFLKSVGQLAKPPCPTLKALSRKGKTVGRHQNRNSSLFDYNLEKLRKESKRRLLQLDVFINLIKELSPDIKVKDEYWYSKYHEAIRNELNEQDYLLLKQLIRTFTVINSQHRTKIEDNTYQVSEQDYLLAFRLLKWKNKPNKSINQAKIIDFLDRIEWYFYDETFNVSELQKKLNIKNIFRIRELLKHYIQKGKIKHISPYKYQLIIDK